MATYLFPANYETQGLAALGVADHDESNLIFQYLDNDLTTFIRDVANYLVIEQQFPFCSQASPLEWH